MSTNSRLVLAIDPGGQHDPTAIVGGQYDSNRAFHVRAVEQIPVGLSFDQQIPLILHVIKHTKPSLIVVDDTGPGRGLAQMLKDDKYTGNWSKKVRNTTITAGTKYNLNGTEDWTISKAELISSLSAALVDIQVPPRLNNRDELKHQLQNFSARVNSNGNIIYGSNNKLDDFVMALSLAVVVSREKKSSFKGSFSSAAHLNINMDTGPTGPDRSLLRYINPDGTEKRTSPYLTRIYSPDM